MYLVIERDEQDGEIRIINEYHTFSMCSVISLDSRPYKSRKSGTYLGKNVILGSWV